MTGRTPAIRRVARGWRRHPVLWTLFSLAVALTIFFGVRAGVQAVYWANSAHRDQAIQGWMTPRYVARSWDVPREVLQRTLGGRIDIDAGPPTLDRIAAARGVSPDDLIAEIEAAIAAHRATGR